MCNKSTISSSSNVILHQEKLQYLIIFSGSCNSGAYIAFNCPPTCLCMWYSLFQFCRLVPNRFVRRYLLETSYIGTGEWAEINCNFFAAKALTGNSKLIHWISPCAISLTLHDGGNSTQRSSLRLLETETVSSQLRGALNSLVSWKEPQDEVISADIARETLRHSQHCEETLHSTAPSQVFYPCSDNFRWRRWGRNHVKIVHSLTISAERTQSLFKQPWLTLSSDFLLGTVWGQTPGASALPSIQDMGHPPRHNADTNRSH